MINAVSNQIEVDKRIPQLDFLRGVAILLVLGRHHPVHATQSGHWLPLAGLWQRFGWAGVDLFFLLSGFLIGSLLLNELKRTETIDLKRFYLRRLFRIWPAYYLFVAFVLVANFKPTVTLTDYLQSAVPMLTHTQNYLGSMREHLWSLSVEEHFYLVLPFVLLLIWKHNQKFAGKLIPALCLLVTACCLGSRLWAVMTLNDYYPGFTWTHNRIDTLMSGVLLAYFYQGHKERITDFCSRHRVAMLFGGLVFLAPMMILRALTIPFVFVVGLPMLACGFSMILLTVLSVPLNHGRIGKFLASPVASFVGRVGVISYAIYLWHCDVDAYMVSKLVDLGYLNNLGLDAKWALVTAVCLFSSLTVGWLSTTLFEQPIMHLRKRLLPGRSPSLLDKQAQLTASDEPVKQLVNV